MKKGVLFSLIVFILLSLLLTVVLLTQKQGNSSETALVDASVYKKVSDKYSNVASTSFVLGKAEAESLIDQRLLPFNYSIDENTFTTSFDLPISNSKVNNYLSSLNEFKIFITNDEYSNEYDSMLVDFNTLLSDSWGGNDLNLHFNIHPQCIDYKLTDLNEVSFSSECSDFNYFSIIRQDLNITLDSSHDFNAISCNFNGASSGPSNCTGVFDKITFDPADPRPYLHFEIFDSECPLCMLSQTIISGHFDPLQESTATISCTGATCATPGLDLNFNKATTLHYTGAQIGTSIAFDFNHSVDLFEFNDVNVSVENSYFGTKRWR